ncbi:MAG: type II toxin-antitoxin system HicB family antitoxin [Actinobacteria bacterium]|nr:MAG: type II toxin-antitoxin system HicB family antitoxin [Actinomycetota bacterium]
MTYKVILERQEEGGYTVFVPKLPDVVSEGDTKKEALENIKDAIKGYLETMEEMGWKPPKIEEETVDVKITAA